MPRSKYYIRSSKTQTADCRQNAESGKMQTAHQAQITEKVCTPVVLIITQPRFQGPFSSYLETLVAAGHVSARFLQIPEM